MILDFRRCDKNFVIIDFNRLIWLINRQISSTIEYYRLIDYIFDDRFLSICYVPRITTGLHPMVMVPRALIFFLSPWRVLVLSSKMIGLHLILSMPRLAPMVLISYLFPWRWLLCLHRKLARLHHITKFPQQSLSCRAFMMDISPLLMYAQMNK